MLKQMLTRKNLGAILLVVAVAVAFVYISKNGSVPQLSASSAPQGASTLDNLAEGLPATVEESNEPAGKENVNDETLTSKDLLPAEDKNAIEFASVAPKVDGSLSDQNFLTAGHLQGELSMAAKNPNYGIRAEPPNPQNNVSPWMNTSIKPDTLRRPLN